MGFTSLLGHEFSEPDVDVATSADVVEEYQIARSASETLLRESAASQRDERRYFMAHDFRHHLCAVYANAELLCGGRFKRAEREEMLRDIWAAVTHMADMLDTCIVGSESTGKTQFLIQPFIPIIERAVQLTKSHPDGKGVELIMQDIPYLQVLADCNWLCSAIFNLLLNACQAVQSSRQSKEIRITGFQDRNHMYIRIMNSGGGVPYSVRTALSQPLVVPIRPTESGLGLAIVRTTIREHGGSLCLEKSQPGSTSFVVRLPKPKCDPIAVGTPPMIIAPFK